MCLVKHSSLIINNKLLRALRFSFGPWCVIHCYGLAGGFSVIS